MIIMNSDLHTKITRSNTTAFCLLFFKLCLSYQFAIRSL